MVKRTNKFRLGAILNLHNHETADFTPIEKAYDQPIEDLIPLAVLFQSYLAKSWLSSFDSSQEKFLQNDPYLGRNRPESWVCLPVYSDQDLKGFLYMEMAGHQEFPVEMIATQLSIYIEQAAILMDSITQLDCLKQQLREQTDELNTARQKLKSSKETSARYFDEMKREIRNPLNTLMGFSQLLVNKSSDLPENIKEYAETINAEGSILTEVLDHVLAISKIEADGKSEQKESVNLKLAVKAALQSCRSLAEKHSIKLKLRLAQNDSSVVRAERTILNWLLKHVIGSSIKRATPGSEIVVMISENQQGPYIDIQYSGFKSTEANQLLDSEIILNEKLCKRLSCSFDQMDHQDTSKINRIIFQNPVNKIQVNWERANQTSVFFSPENTVVVFREEADSDRVLDSMLKEMGLSPTVCDTPQQLLDLVSTRSPQAVLFDIHLVRRSGVIGTLKQSKHLLTTVGQVPLIIVSNDTHFHSRSFAIHSIEFEVLSKPLKLNQLIQSLKPLLNKAAITLPLQGAQSEVKSWKHNDFKFVNHTTTPHSFSGSPKNLEGELRQLLAIPIYKGGSLLACVRKIRESASVRDPYFMSVLNKIEKAIFEGNEIQLSKLVKSALSKKIE